MQYFFGDAIMIVIIKVHGQLISILRLPAPAGAERGVQQPADKDGDQDVFLGPQWHG
jgi:hypothetical protein